MFNRLVKETENDKMTNDSLRIFTVRDIIPIIAGA
jgi:hypothetical protein